MIHVLSHQVGDGCQKSGQGTKCVIYLSPVELLSGDFLADSIHLALDALMQTGGNGLSDSFLDYKYSSKFLQKVWDQTSLL